MPPSGFFLCLRRTISAPIFRVTIALCAVFFGASKGAAPENTAAQWDHALSDDAFVAFGAKISGCQVDSDLFNAASEYAKPNTAFLIGEMHGTFESPQFALDVACLALGQRFRVTVALEIPHQQEDHKLQEFLASRQAGFTDGPFWNSSFQDGRSSVAMRRLIEQIRIWRKYYPVRLLTIDDPESHGQQRDAAMARNLANDIRKHKYDVYVVLTGNVHSSLKQGTPWDSKYAPMGHTLMNLVGNDTSIVSLEPQYYAGGSAYICTASNGSSCGETILKKARKDDLPSDDIAPRGVKISRNSLASNRLQGYYYFTTPVTSSPPAVSN
jgi:hypothetical protein